MVEKATRKREYAMSYSSEVTVNCEIVVPRTRKQIFKGLVHISTHRHGASSWEGVMLRSRQQRHESG
jgi:hypothetical protein